MTTSKELAAIVAEDFMKTIKEWDFENFTDMKDCYDWDSKDIRTEVEYTIHAAETGWEMQDDSDIYCFVDGASEDFITYRKFISMVYSILKQNKMY